MTPCRMVQTCVFINVAVSVCMYVCMYVYLCICVYVCIYVCTYVPHNTLQYIFVIIYSVIRMWIGFNYGAFLNSCRVSTVWGCCLSGYVAVYITQLRGCSGLCGCVQHTAMWLLWVTWLSRVHSCVGCSGLCEGVQHTTVWLLWVVWRCTAHNCVVALGYVAVYSKQLCGCSGLCGCVQHTAVWLIWIV